MSLVAVSERILGRDPMEEIRRAFQLFDDDNTGKISLRNLRRVAKEIGDRLEDDELYVFHASWFHPPDSLTRLNTDKQ
jgi:Ca2+-binding EF-hand superfamily protein